MSLTAPRPRMLVVSSATRMLRFFKYPDSRARRRLDSNTSRTLSCSISWARNTCSVLLAKGLSSTSIPKATPGRGRGQALPADVEVGPGLGLGVADLVVRLEQEGRGK